MLLRSTDCRRCNHNLRALYGNHLEQVSGYASLAKTNPAARMGKERELCTRVCEITYCEHVCVKRACTTRGREPIKSNAIVVTIPLCFSMLFPGKPRKPKNTISIQSRSIHGSEMIKIYYDFNNFLDNLKSALF